MSIHSINSISSSATNFIKENVVPRLRGLLDHKIALIATATFLCLAGLAIWSWRRLQHNYDVKCQQDKSAWLALGGYELFQAGKLDEAAQKYQDALAICPEDTQKLVSYALVLLKQGNDDEASKQIEKAFSHNLNPKPDDSILAIFNYARALEEQGSLDEAVEVIERAFSYMVNPDDRIDPLHARLLKKLGKYEEAETEYKKLFARGTYYQNEEYVEVLRLQGKVKEAEKFEEDYLDKLKLQLGLDKERTNPEALDSYARAFARQGKLDEAAKIFEELLSIDQGSMFFTNYADVLVKQGKLDEAAKLYDAWLIDETRNASVNKGYADLLRLQGKTNEAKKFEDECLARDDILKNGFELKEAGKLVEAAKEYEKLFTSSKTHSVFEHYVDILRRQGNVQGAEKFEEDCLKEIELRFGLDKDRKNPYALNSYALLLHRMNRFDEAIKIYEEILSVDQKSFYVANYAAILVHLRKFDDAAKLYEAALLISKDNSAMNKGYANLLRMQGKTDEAKKFEDDCQALVIE